METSVTVNSNLPIQDYVHPDDQTQPAFEMTPGFKPFTDSGSVVISDITSEMLSELSTLPDNPGDSRFWTLSTGLQMRV